MLSQLKGLKQITVKFRAEQIFCTFLIHQSSFLGMHKMLCTKKQQQQQQQQKNELKVFISLKENKLAYFPNGLKLYITRCTRGTCFFITVMARALQKSQQTMLENCVTEFPILSTAKLPLCELVVYIEMNTYILMEGRKFKTLLKENYGQLLLWTIVTYFLKICLNMILIVLMEFSENRHS